MIVLTRYLYIKEEVLTSLFISILNKDRQQALFWAYEYYYSGFKEEACYYLYSIYKQCFWSQHPGLQKAFTKWHSRGHEIPEYIGHMVLNLCSPARKYELVHFLHKTMPSEVSCNVSSKRKVLLLTFPLGDLKYYNHGKHVAHPRTILKKRCLYAPERKWVKFLDCYHCDYSYCDLFQIQTSSKWLYYASFSPLWKSRIEQHDGVVDEVHERIMFKGEEQEELFYNHFGYEPDEQSLQTQSILCPTFEPGFCTYEDFIQTYNCIVRKIKKSRTTLLQKKGNVSNTCV